MAGEHGVIVMGDGEVGSCERGRASIIAELANAEQRMGMQSGEHVCRGGLIGERWDVKSRSTLGLHDAAIR